MNCKFCSVKCDDIIVSNIYRYSKCCSCRTEFRSNNVVNIYFEYKEKSYIYQERFAYNKVEPARFMQSTGTYILSLNKIPKDITPSNVLQKFKIYILFS